MVASSTGKLYESSKLNIDGARPCSPWWLDHPLSDDIVSNIVVKANPVVTKKQVI